MVSQLWQLSWVEVRLKNMKIHQWEKPGYATLKLHAGAGAE